MSDQILCRHPQLSGKRQKELRHWLELPLPQYAEMTSESTATHSRREQEDVPLTGPTEALLLVLDYLYGLHEGPERKKVETLRQLLKADSTRRHFIGRFGAAALTQMMQDAGLSIEPLSVRIQAWCKRDHQQTVERTAGMQLQRMIGLSGAAVGSVVGAALAGISWTWLAHLFSPPAPARRKETKKEGGTSPKSTAAGKTAAFQEQEDSYENSGH